MADSLYVFKIIIAGDSGVGKTTLVRRYVDGVFSPSKKATIGIDYFVKNVVLTVNGKDFQIALQVWDLAGEEKYRTFLPSYIPGTNGFFYVYSEDIHDSLSYLDAFNTELASLMKEKIPILLIKAKKDLKEEFYKKNSIEEFMDKNGISEIIDTSSKTGENVNASFQKIAEIIANEKGLFERDVIN